MSRPLSAAGAAAVCAAGMLALAGAMGIGRFAFTPLLPVMVREGSVDLAAGGWLAAANYIGYLAGALSAARVPLAPWRLVVVALSGVAAVTAAMALPAGLAVWWVLRLASGLFSAWAFVGVTVWCLGLLAASGRPAWAGFLYAGVGSGIALAGLLCLGAGVMGLGASGLWLALGAGAAVMLGLAFAVATRAGAALPMSMGKPAAQAAAAHAPPARLNGLILCYGVMGFGYILPATFLPALARQLIDDPAVFGLAWPLFGATAAASTLLAAWGLRRLPRAQVWAACHVLMGLGVLLPSLWLSGLSIALSALLVGGTFMVVTMAGMQEARERAGDRATAMAARMTAAFALGQIAGPLLSALLLRWPALREQGLTLSLQLAAALLLATAPWLWRQAKKQPP